MWLNFSQVNAMFIYWPLVLIGLSVTLIVLPAPVLYYQSRKWWVATNVCLRPVVTNLRTATDIFSGACGALDC